MILDATAGNRTMWQNRNNRNVIYIDMEKKLEVKPTVFADNKNTPFLDATFDTIFYDPPHAYGAYTSRHSQPSRAQMIAKYQDKRANPPYFGWDKYKTEMALLHHVFDAQKEFKRILKDDGLLWLKWNEVCIHLGTIIRLFEDWTELMRILVDASVHTAGKCNTYWVCLCKKKRRDVQSRLS